MAYRNKVYVCFDGDTDMHYYRLMTAWHQNDHTPFSFYNAHAINQARDNSLELTIKSRLRERFQETKTFVILIGENTRYLYKFVRWEIEEALRRGLPIIVVNLNSLRQQDTDRCPPILRNELAIHVSFRAAILQYALEHWPDRHSALKAQGLSGPYFYKSEVYQQLGVFS